MSADRELLELAARAAGQERSAAGDLWSNARGALWNPLVHDGDALRLAVKLQISIEFDSPWFEPEEKGINARCGEVHALEPLDSSDDPQTATRRAIVRAAAALAAQGSTGSSHG